MEERIKDKSEEIEKYLLELLDIIPDNFEEYEKDFKIKAACERYFEKIIEAVVDLAFLFSRKMKYPSPKEEEAIFDILAGKNVIPWDFANRLKAAKSMRNFIAHEYGELDDKLVFQAINEQLEKDIKEFINIIKKGYEDENII